MVFLYCVGLLQRRDALRLPHATCDHQVDVGGGPPLGRPRHDALEAVLARGGHSGRPKIDGSRTQRNNVHRESHGDRGMSNGAHHDHNVLRLPHAGRTRAAWACAPRSPPTFRSRSSRRKRGRVANGRSRATTSPTSATWTPPYPRPCSSTPAREQDLEVSGSHTHTLERHETVNLRLYMYSQAQFTPIGGELMVRVRQKTGGPEFAATRLSALQLRHASVKEVSMLGR